jgi:hypothetical protein
LRDLCWAADQGGVVDADDLAGDEVAVGQSRRDGPAVEGHGPGDAGDALDAVELRVLKRLGVIDVLDLGIHHPQVNNRQLGDHRRAARQDAEEDRRLLHHHESGEGKRCDDAEILAALVHEHGQRKT